ncbi:MAG TPA: MarR family transcriptional regulator [Solirubrobacteraceae bacterium]|nr:MarR family transcriptional regulator [Solirubrobacteraceae bacterium]
MGADPPKDEAEAITREAWLLLSDLVLDNTRRREVADALGISFGSTRALRRIARRPMTMGELAAALGIDPPNATVVVDDLERQGLVRRRPHPSDGRTKLVETTPRGRELAARADQILAEPPAALTGLGDGDLQTLLQILKSIRANA